MDDDRLVAGFSSHRSTPDGISTEKRKKFSRENLLAAQVFPSRLSFIATFRSFTSNKRVAVQKRKIEGGEKKTRRNFKNRKKKFFIESKENHFHLKAESERFLHSLDGFSISLVDWLHCERLSIGIHRLIDCERQQLDTRNRSRRRKKREKNEPPTVDEIIAWLKFHKRQRSA